MIISLNNHLQQLQKKFNHVVYLGKAIDLAVELDKIGIQLKLRKKENNTGEETFTMSGFKLNKRLGYTTLYCIKDSVIYMVLFLIPLVEKHIFIFAQS